MKNARVYSQRLWRNGLSDPLYRVPISPILHLFKQNKRTEVRITQTFIEYKDIHNPKTNIQYWPYTNEIVIDFNRMTNMCIDPLPHESFPFFNHSFL